MYFVHHASISTTLRKQAEETMKQEDELAVTGATLTLELGIDLGKLDRIVQTDSPFTVSSFVQRLGKSGRRGQPSEMLFFFKEEVEDRPKEFYEKIDFAFLKCIAIIELYLKEKWIETLEKKFMSILITISSNYELFIWYGSSLTKRTCKIYFNTFTI